MSRVFLGFCLALALTNLAEARPRRSPSRTYSYTNSAPSNVDTSSAQGVAEAQAQCGQCRHFGGNSGYEGVGFSSAGPEEAKRNCCFWGSRTPREIGVARGPRGWFACVRYW